LRGIFKGIYVLLVEEESSPILLDFLALTKAFLISLDFRSKNLYLSVFFENGPNGKSKVFL